MCLKKEVHKARTFVLGPYQEWFCDTDAEFRYSEILALIKPDINNIFLFSLLVPPPLLKRHTYVFQPLSPCLNHRAPPPSTNSYQYTSTNTNMFSSDPMSLSLYAHDWAALINPPVTSPGATAVYNLVAQFLQAPLSSGGRGVGANLGSYQEHPVTVTHGKTVVVLHTKISYCALCCHLIGDEGGKV